MTHQRTENIGLPEYRTGEDVKASINSWMNTSVGSQYSVKSRGESFVTIERRWTPSSQYCWICFGILPGLICIAMSKKWISFSVNLQEGSVVVNMSSNFAKEADIDYGSFIHAIKGSGSSSPGPSF